MNKLERYRVPDVLDILYEDIVGGLYFPITFGSVKNRILISKCNIACDLLLNSSMCELQISEHLEFPDIESFRKSFSNFLGINPVEFRNRFAT
jgi:hypothetical protein